MQFCRVTTIEEALVARANWGNEGQILAGGTDVMVQYLHGEISPGALIHIEGLDELSELSMETRTTLGALTSHRTLVTTPALAQHHPALSSAAATVGGWQTQVKGTLGGNICNASPAADLVAPLLIADAHVTLKSSSDERRMPIGEFILDRRTTALRPDELLLKIDLEPVSPRTAEVYLKLGRRGAMEVALVGIAMRLEFTADGEVNDARIAACSVGPRPRRFPEAEAALIGSKLEPSAMTDAGAALMSAATPIDDARSTARYRRRTLGGLLERAARRCMEESRR